MQQAVFSAIPTISDFHLSDIESKLRVLNLMTQVDSANASFMPEMVKVAKTVADSAYSAQTVSLGLAVASNLASLL